MKANGFAGNSDEELKIHRAVIIVLMEPKKDKTEISPASIFVLEEKKQPIGPFNVPFFYQISGVGNPNINLRCRQIKIPGIIYDGTDISMVKVGDLISITNTGSTVVETTNPTLFLSALLLSPPNQYLIDSPNKTTLTPSENIQLKLNEIAFIEISWNPQSEEEQQHIVAKFTFNQGDRQIYASCEVQPILVTPLP